MTMVTKMEATESALVRAMFDHEAAHFDALNGNVRFGSVQFAGDDCTVVQVKRNAIVRLMVPNPAATPKALEQRKATCRQIAQTQMSKVVDAALG